MNELVNQEETTVPAIATSKDVVFNAAAFNSIMELGKVMAACKATIPQHLQGKPADCTAIAMQSMTWNMDPFVVAQKTHLVSGTLGYEAQLVNAVITSRAPTKERLHFEWFGPWENIIGKFAVRKSDKGEYHVPDWSRKDEAGLGVKVWATIIGEDEPRVLSLMLLQATVRNSTLWASDPRQQLAYLAIKRWARLYVPDVILGVYTPDELKVPRGPAPGPEGARDVTPAKESKADSILNKVKKNKEPANIEGEVLAPKEPELTTLAKLEAYIMAAKDRKTMDALAAVIETELSDQDEIDAMKAVWMEKFGILKQQHKEKATK